MKEKTYFLDTFLTFVISVLEVCAIAIIVVSILITLSLALSQLVK